ncbi:MAG: 1-acyl-sn-glycerol-3-phosphate acyltransferase [Gaiellaceae bacterium]
MPDLYDAVAFGMWAYSQAAFRVETLGPPRLRLPAGTLIVATHRKETDVPILCPPLYLRAGMRTDRPRRMHFAARDDMFLPGFFAGFPQELPGWARRLLYPVGVRRWLPVVNVHPIRSANVARLGEVLAARPDAPLGELLPAEALAPFQRRGLTAASRARDAIRGDYADLLWRAVTAADVAPGLEDFWSAHAAQAARSFRELVELVRTPTTLVVFPEGRPSPNGEIGPLQPGIGALVRRGHPVAIQPFAFAYDPLVAGRTRVLVSLPDLVEPPDGEVEAALLGLLRRSMPLTAGQFAAHRLLEGVEAAPGPLERELAEAVEAAQAEGRPVEPALLTLEGRRSRLAEALAVAPRKPEELAFLALEYRSARDL